jgi:hypothetical protein
LPTAVSAPTPLAVPTAADPPAPVPDVDPAAAALALLRAIDPSLDDQTRGHIAGVTAELADLVERARLQTSMPLAEFVSHAGRLTRLQQTLEGRLADASSRGDVATRAYSLLVAVRRWKPRSELRADRQRILDGLHSELAQVEADLGALSATFTAGGVLAMDVNTDEYKAGLADRSDEFLRRATPLLAKRQDLARRIARLDSIGDAGRAVLVADALDVEGGPAAVAAAIAATMPAESASGVAKAKATAERLQSQLSTIDPETRKAAELKESLQDVQGRVQTLQNAAGAEQQSSGRGPRRPGRHGAIRGPDGVAGGGRRHVAGLGRDHQHDSRISTGADRDRGRVDRAGEVTLGEAFDVRRSAIFSTSHEHGRQPGEARLHRRSDLSRDPGGRSRRHRGRP